MAEKSAACTSAKVEAAQDDLSGGWWGSWITSAKSKSAEVYSMVKKDLDEIGTAVKCEANHVFSTTSNVIGKTLKLDEPESTANVMKKSFSSFIGQVSSALSPIPYNDEDDTEIVFSSGDTTMLSTYKRELEALQRVDATFIVTADSPEFDAWKTTREGAEEIITPQSAFRKMEDSPVLKSQYEKLVPDAVSHDEFWERYLFRLALLHDRLAAASRKQPISEESTDPVIAHLPMPKSPSPIKQSPKKVMSSPLVSDDEFETEAEVWPQAAAENSTDIELTEEQQILLLEEYEREISTKKSQSSNTCNNNKNNSKRGKKGQVRVNNNRKGQKTPDECGNVLVEDYFDGNSDAPKQKLNC